MMSKYDFDIDLSCETSTGLILSKIKPGSKVLEFGCANGRMTRYMSRALDCNVSIVEYDENAYRDAEKYAADGVCGDIMDFEWVKKYKDACFDYVLFADVLEHLSDPDAVLRNVKKVLGDKGTVIISIPNITNSDIAIKAYQDHFDYTKVGLLDDTHIHFWGLKNIEPFARYNGFAVEWIRATYVDLGDSEQFPDGKPQIDPVYYNILNKHAAGTVYQFVFSLKKAEKHKDLKPDVQIKNPVYTSYIYLDEGKDFCEDEKLPVSAEYIGNGEYSLHFVIEDVKNVHRLRFDPVEYQSCLIRFFSVRQDDKELDYIYNDHAKTDDGLFLLSHDPMLMAEPDENGGAVIVDAVFIPEDQNFLKFGAAALRDTYEKTKELSQELDSERTTSATKDSEIARLLSELSEKESRIEALNTELSAREAELSAKEVELEKSHDNEESVNEQLKKSDKDRESKAEEIRNYQVEVQRLNNEMLKYKMLAVLKDELLIDYERKEIEINNRIEEMDAEKQSIIGFYENRRAVRFANSIRKTLGKNDTSPFTGEK